MEDKSLAQKDYIVSAIVSAYNCERFIAGCLEDLERQTIADRLEIVVVNSGSQEDEETIIKQFQEKFDNIVYIKTGNRETIYKAWNRGIKSASGKYITNANADDRHRKDAFEIMVNELESDRNIDLVYADDIVTETENETFEHHTPTGCLNWPEFDQHELLCRSFIGPHPMWRKGLHERFGYFDGSFAVSGDYEFWLRISEKCRFKHIKEYLGLYLRNPNSAERRDYAVTFSETERIVNKYLIRASDNKKLLKALKGTHSRRVRYLGYLYYEKRFFRLARKAFLRSISYNWRNIRSYQWLIACYLPPEMVQILRRIKRLAKISALRN